MKDVQVEEIPSATVENHRVSIMREKLRDLENRFWRPGVQTMEAEGGKAVDGKEATVKLLLVECFLECREGKEEKTRV